MFFIYSFHLDIKSKSYKCPKGISHSAGMPNITRLMTNFESYGAPPSRLVSNPPIGSLGRTYNATLFKAH